MHTQHQIAYRSDIDGLRAIAVLSVLLFHLDERFLPYGYLGVDVFFVISGYLITAIIHKEMAEKRFSILHFYEKRIRRIVPALTFVGIGASIAAWFLLLPIDLVGYGKSLIATTSFTANIYFWRDVNYFAQESDLKPLLHMWSLGIEEQFYIFFPPLLMLFRGRALRLGFIALLVVLSLGLNIYALSAGAAIPAFYLLPTRAWELGIGALLTMAPAVRLPRAGHGLLSALGLLLLLAGVSLGRLVSPLPLPDALPAVLGTALVLWTGGMEKGAVARLLSLKVMTGIGLISYSLYLWHWPIVVFLRYYLVGELDMATIAVAAAVTFLMAYLSWKYVEQPFRNKSVTRKQIFAMGGICAAVLIGIGAAMIAAKGAPARFDGAAGRIGAVVGTHYRCALADQFAFGARTACTLSTAGTKTPDLVLLGNSHAQMYAPIIADLAKTNGISAMMVPANGCAPIATYNIRPGCIRIAETNMKAVEALPARTVVLAFQWNIADRLVDQHGKAPASGADALITALDASIARLQKSGKSVVLVGPIASPEYNVSSEYSRSLAYGRAFHRPLGTQEGDFMRWAGPLIGHYRARSDILFLQPHQFQCRQGRCDYFRDTNGLFADSNHVARSALPLFAGQFAPLGQFLAKRAQQQ